MRTSALINYQNKSIIIDCGPDFRQQMLREGVTSLDAILLTHEHNDHVIGLDDVRPFNFKNKREMLVFASKRVEEELKKRFAYIFAKKRYPGAPMITVKTINPHLPFDFDGISITPIQIQHGKMPVLGFRINDFTYLTDLKTIDEEELKKVKGTKALVISALHQRQHHSHLNLTEAIELVNVIRPQHAYLTHISHRMGCYDEVSKFLPENISLAYDGLKISI